MACSLLSLSLSLTHSTSKKKKPPPQHHHQQPKKRKQELGIAAADLKRLKEGGINTIESLAHATKKELCLIKGISEAKVVKMQQEGERKKKNDFFFFECFFSFFSFSRLESLPLARSRASLPCPNQPKRNVKNQNSTILSRSQPGSSARWASRRRRSSPSSARTS